jgi:pyridoxal phosphate enzyme (YggS family)
MTDNTHTPRARLETVRARIEKAALQAGRPPQSIELLAVSKTRDAGAIAALADLGQRHFGESYLQEAVAKVEALGTRGLTWHFIGPLQSNKTRQVATHFHWVHSVDRLKLARRLSEQRPPDLAPLNICLQVNVSGEASKSGVAPEELPSLAAAVRQLPNLCLRGLMAIPAPTHDSDAQREPFRALRHMFESLNERGFNLDTLSMGMSGDLEAAIAEGATIVRVGTALFGPRPVRD